MKKILILLLTLLLTGAVSCSKAKDKKVVIEYSRWGTPEEVKSTRKLLKLFSQKHPDIKVQFTYEPWSGYWNKLQAQMAAGAGPDVFLMGAIYIADFYEKGMLKNLQPFFDKDKIDLSAYYQSPFEIFTFNKQLYGFPRDLNAIVLFYNKDLFDKAGVSYPDNSWTWNDYRKAAQKLTRDKDNDGNMDIWGTSTAMIFETYWGNLLLQAGGSVLNEDKTECLINSSHAQKAIQFMYDLEHKYNVAPNAATKASMDVNIFTTGNVAMIFDGSWMFRAYSDAPFNWDISVLPRNKRRACIANGVGHVMKAGTSHEKAAWKLIKFLSDKKAQIAVAHSGTSIPVMKSVANSSAFLTGKPDNKKAALNSLEFGYNYPVTPKMNHWLSTIIKKEIEKILLKQTPVDEGLYQAKKRADAILNSN
ncbi:MAG TPA: sugar ABC transporter substrate-binding protein [Spirochaetota bacterium]|nr:sugar ABC transporter substrate-binding protein [Spirochaetota bacterium]